MHIISVWSSDNGVGVVDGCWWLSGFGVGGVSGISGCVGGFGVCFGIDGVGWCWMVLDNGGC